MSVDFTVFKGSSDGSIVEAKGHRELKPTEVAIKITSCGVCGTDEHYLQADQGLGHEGVGTITALGEAVSHVSDFAVGDVVGMGWWHKVCGRCKACLAGHQNSCEVVTNFGSADQDQGCFGTACVWDVSTLYKIPSGMKAEDAGPMMCGGATVWEPLYTGGLQPGDRVGILGVGGLGHLAIQFAAKMGFEPVVFSTSADKEQEAKKFGAKEFHCTKNNMEQLANKVEKVNMLLVTANVIPQLRDYLPFLAKRASVYPLTVGMEALPFSSLDLIGSQLKIVGSACASTGSIKLMLQFAADNGIKPQTEKFSMSKQGIEEAMKKLRDGKMRYRGVLVN